MQLDWCSGSVDLSCPVCGRAGDQELVAGCAVPWWSEPVPIARCRDCGAIVLGRVLGPHEYGEGAWEEYVELTASPEVIATTLATAGAPRGSRVLDIGCGYGFALDLSRFLWGWDGVGLDPSYAAQMGRTELGLDIRPGYLDALDGGERFDVIVASEVLEHVPDPLEFLASVRDHLTEHGVFVMTTPDAAVVRPDVTPAIVAPALSVGLHAFLVDASSLRRLFAAVGLDAEIWSNGASLNAVASVDAGARAAVDPGRTVALTDLAAYCAARNATAPTGSALAVGTAARRVKFLAYGPGIPDAAPALPALRGALRDRYHLDLDHPETLFDAPYLPVVYALAAYFDGIVACYLGDLDRAETLFSLAAETGRRHHVEHGAYVVPAPAQFETQALGEQALLAVRRGRDPEPALTALAAAAERGACDAALVEEFRTRAANEVRLPPPSGGRRSVRSLARRLARTLPTRG